MRTPLRLSILFFLASLPACTSTAPPPDFVWDDKRESLAVAARLAEPIDVSWESTTVAAAMDDFRSQTGVNVHVNWAALSGASVEKDAPVAITLKQVPAHIVLDLLINQMRGGSEASHFGVVDGIVRVSTRRDLQRLVDTRVYNINDMLVVAPGSTNGPEFDLSTSLGGGSTGGQGLPKPPAMALLKSEEERAMAERCERILPIITIIQESVGSQSDWQCYGGDVSSLRELNGNLIIKTTPANHRTIERLLRALLPPGAKVVTWQKSDDGKTLEGAP